MISDNRHSTDRESVQLHSAPVGVICSMQRICEQSMRMSGAGGNSSEQEWSRWSAEWTWPKAMDCQRSMEQEVAGRERSLCDITEMGLSDERLFAIHVSTFSDF
jgi:hypothetical protein